MGLSEKLTQIKNEITSLLTYANTKTGESDATLGDAVETLVEGYGTGGGGDIDALIDGSIVDVNSNALDICNYAFYYLKNLTSAVFPNTTNIGSSAFYNCSKLTSVACPKVASINSYAFYNCSKLTSIACPNATGISNSAFENCVNLTDTEFTNVINIGSRAFYNCSKLTFVVLPKVETIESAAFYRCAALVSADFHKLERIGSNAFAGCTSLAELILRGRKISTYSAASSGYDPPYGNIKIYVPRDLVESYKVATNWSRLADKFVALEDYTVDGTTTGAMNRDSNGNIVVRT